jgi:hypothetical protein
MLMLSTRQLIIRRQLLMLSTRQLIVCRQMLMLSTRQVIIRQRLLMLSTRQLIVRRQMLTRRISRWLGLCASPGVSSRSRRTALRTSDCYATAIGQT